MSLPGFNVCGLVWVYPLRSYSGRSDFRQNWTS